MKIEFYVLEKDGTGHIIINKAKAEGFFIKREGFQGCESKMCSWYKK